MKVFVSHSHKDKELAGSIKEELERAFEFDVFVAHDDINPSEEWRRAILEELKECDVFLALLSRDFEDSNWTDQESGAAVAWDKTVVPISIDINPYGFISKFQAFKWDSEDLAKNIYRLIEVLYKKGKFSKAELIESFAKSRSYDIAGYIAQLLLEVGNFTPRQINSIAKATASNDQILGSGRAYYRLRKLFSRYKDVIQPELIPAIKKYYS